MAIFADIALLHLRSAHGHTFSEPQSHLSPELIQSWPQWPRRGDPDFGPHWEHGKIWNRLMFKNCKCQNPSKNGQKPMIATTDKKEARNTCAVRCSVATATTDKLQLASQMWMSQHECRFTPVSGSITVCNIRGGKPSKAMTL